MNNVKFKVHANSWNYIICLSAIAEKSKSYYCYDTDLLSCYKHLISFVKKIVIVENPVYFIGTDKCDFSGLTWH